MNHLLAIAIVLLFAAPAMAQPQCPESHVAVEIVSDDTPACATIVPAVGKPELNVTNQCGEDPFHLEAGVDCPHCGPPLTLRMGTFGAFVVNTQPLGAFTPDSVPTEHQLSWARVDATGSMRVRVVPNITLCPLPDMGGAPDVGVDLGSALEADGEPGGCATAAPAELGLGLALFGLVAVRRAQRRRTNAANASNSAIHGGGSSPSWCCSTMQNRGQVTHQRRPGDVDRRGWDPRVSTARGGCDGRKEDCGPGGCEAVPGRGSA